MVTSAFRSRGLNGIPEIRTFFRTNEQPIFFIGPTAFNLLGIDRWVRGFEYIVYHDSWDSSHPRVFTPNSKPYVEFNSSEEINNYLLRDPEVQRHIESRCAATGSRSSGPATIHEPVGALSRAPPAGPARGLAAIPSGGC